MSSKEWSTKKVLFSKPWAYATSLGAFRIAYNGAGKGTYMRNKKEFQHKLQSSEQL